MALFYQEKGSATAIAFVAETTPKGRGIWEEFTLCWNMWKNTQAMPEVQASKAVG